MTILSLPASAPFMEEKEDSELPARFDIMLTLDIFNLVLFFLNVQCKLGAFSILRSLFSHFHMDGSDYLKAFLFPFFFCRSLRKNKQCVNDCCGDSEQGVCVTRALYGLRARNKSTRCAVFPLYSISPLLILSTSSAPVVALVSESLSS